MSTFDETRIRRGQPSNRGQFVAKQNSAPAVFLPSTNGNAIASARAEMIRDDLRDAGVINERGNFDPDSWDAVSDRIAHWTTDAIETDRGAEDGSDAAEYGRVAAETIREDLKDGRYLDRYGIRDETCWEDVGWRVEDAIASAVYQDRQDRQFARRVKPIKQTGMHQ